ncbi:MAG: D-glycerate dehydrogenase, partial [Chloroflexales bacterium]|nr:D-glycerate dehydrogenase [Chloroflexales bacterium]
LDIFKVEPIDEVRQLLVLPNVMVVRHIGSVAVANRTRTATLAATNLVAAVTGQTVPSPINLDVPGR